MSNCPIPSISSSWRVGTTQLLQPETIAARQDTVFHTRAYWPNGRKRWFQHAGRDFYFVIPRDRIALVFARGYSYVPVVINGQTLHLNVSGGTCDDGWTDFVRQVSVGIQFSKQKLDLLAEAALPPEESRGKASLELTELSAGDAAGFVELLAGQVCRSRLENVHKLVLRDGCSYDGSRGPFFLETKATRRRYYIAKVGSEHRAGFRAPYTTIDWTATAAANEFAVPRPIQENRVG